MLWSAVFLTAIVVAVRRQRERLADLARLRIIALAKSTKESDRSSATARFGVFEADFRAFELRRQGRRVALQEQPLQVLKILVECPGELVSRERLHQELWPEEEYGTFDHRINSAINKLRLALGDSADNPSYIETVTKHGYRFLPPLEPVEAPVVPPRTSSRWPYLVVAAGVVGGVVLTYYARQESSVQPVGTERIMLAVLPFDNYTGDPSQDYLTDGFTEELISRLGQLNSDKLGVIARTSVMAYKTTEASVEEIARTLNVDYLVEGSVRRDEDRFRITAQLVRADDQTHVWADSFDQPLLNLLDLQSSVSEGIANSLAIQALPGSVLVPGTSADAYEAYLKGRFFRNQVTAEGFAKGVENFERALQEDPGFAPAYSGMASCYCLLSGHGMEVVPPSEAMPRAFELARQALELDHRLGEAWAVQGMVHLKYHWDFSAAEGAFQQALSLEPSNAQAHLWYSLYLEAMGHQEKAVERARRALALDPLSLETNVNLGHQLAAGESWSEASAYLEKALELSPDFWGARWELGNLLREQGDYEAALVQYAEASRLSSGNTVTLASLAYAHALDGNRAASKALLDELIAKGESSYISPAFVAYVYAGLGDVDEAFRWLERAYEYRSRYLVWLNVAPEYDRLRSDPRFDDLVSRIGLPN